MAERFDYLNLPQNKEGHNLVVESLSLDEALDVSEELLLITAFAYSTAFVGESLRLDLSLIDTVARRFTPVRYDDYSNFERHRRFMVKHYGEGGQVTVVRDHIRDRDNDIVPTIVAYAKTRPALAATDGEFEGLYLNEIVAHNEVIGKVTSFRGCYLDYDKCVQKGFGSLALHAALKFGDHDLDGPMVLRSFPSTYATYWNLRHGLKHVRRTEPFDFGGGVIRPRAIYATPPGLTVGGVVARLERRHPYLAEVGPCSKIIKYSTAPYLTCE